MSPDPKREDTFRVGLISDTHGNVPRTLRALEQILASDIRALLHAGDIGSDEVLDEIVARCEAYDVEVHAVRGNIEEWTADMWRLPGDRPVPFLATPIIGGKHFALLHGHRADDLERAIRSGDFDYVVTGHTHEWRDERIGCTRVINPGAVHRASPPSVAVLDIHTDTLIRLPLDP